MTFPARPDSPLRDQLNAVHALLLRIHKSLVDLERFRFEQTVGPVGTPLEFLDRLLNDPTFAWLRPLSELIVQIDEAASARTGVDRNHAAALLAQTRHLLTPSDDAAHPFHPRYLQALQDSPDLTAAHADFKRALPPV